MKEERLIGNSGIQEIRQQCLDILAEIREQAGILNDYFEVTDSPEYIAAWVDGDGKVIFGLKADGKTFVGDADFLDDLKRINEFLPHSNVKIDWDALSIITLTDNSEFLNIEIDEDGHILSSRNRDGIKREHVGFETPKVSIDGHIIENIEDPEGRTEIITDSEGKIISYRDSDGVKHEKVGIETDNATVNHLNLTESGMTEFQQALKDSGFQPGGCGDWSDYISNDGDNPLCIPEPRCAKVNIISDYDLLTLRKNINIPITIEFWDMSGNYFKKQALMNGQGNSSLGYEKKNIALDLFDSSIDGDAFAIKFGDWVSQDSFHLKAAYLDFFKGVSFIAYDIADIIQKDRGWDVDKPWKKELVQKYNFDTEHLNDNPLDDIDLQIDNGARNMPNGFPCVVYQNGNFWGLFIWGIKKQRDNYNLNKSKAEHIHLDGTGSNANPSNLFDGSINWTQFEIRNPKSLLTNIPIGYGYTEVSDIPSEYQDSPDNIKPSELTQDDIIRIYGSVEQAPQYLKYITSKGKTKYYKLGASFRAYNGDYPSELLGEDTVGYDASNDAHVFTNKVKQYIINLSHVMGNIANAESENDKKEIVSTHFDVDNLIDYEITQLITQDPDCTKINWQWVTYDGVKWYVNNYDKDRSFGNTNNIYLIKPKSGWYSAKADYYPTSVLKTLYTNEFKERWNSLLSRNIIDSEHITDLVKKWVDRFGADNYSQEYKKWPFSPCNRDPKVNSEYWVFNSYYVTEEYKDQVNVFDIDTQYNTGETVYYQYDNTGYLYEFTCKKNCIGVVPIYGNYAGHDGVPEMLGYRDSIWRIKAWIEKAIYLENLFINSL